MNEQTAKGVRIKDMPDEWFAMPSDEEMKNVPSVLRTEYVCALLGEKNEEKAEMPNSSFMQLAKQFHTL